MNRDEFLSFLTGKMTPEEKDSFIRIVKSYSEAHEDNGDLIERLFWDCENKEDVIMRVKGIEFAGIDSFLAVYDENDEDLGILSGSIDNLWCRVIQVGYNSVMITSNQADGYWEAYDLDLNLPYCAESLIQVLIDIKVQTLDYVDHLFSRPLASMIYDDIQRVNFINSDTIGGLDNWREEFVAGIDKHIAVSQPVK